MLDAVDERRQVAADLVLAIGQRSARQQHLAPSWRASSL